MLLPMKVSATDARRDYFRKLLDTEAPVIITWYGTPVCVVVPYQDYCERQLPAPAPAPAPDPLPYPGDRGRGEDTDA